MKFKEFFIKTGSEYLRTACIDKGIDLGYKVYKQDGGFVGGFIFHSDGDFQSVYSNHNPEKFCEMDIYSFFKLTPDDVRVEPKLIRCVLSTNSHHLSDLSETEARLTQDQIDRIKSIMDEDQS